MPPPTALARQTATWALGQRTAFGSDAARDVLLRQVAEPERPDIRRRAVHTLRRSRRRHRIKRQLKALLPAEQHYLLHEVR